MLRLSSLLLLAGALAGAAHAQEREWSLDGSDSEAYLIFGVPDSDDVGVSLWCPMGKDLVHLYLPLPTSDVPKGADKSMPVTVSAGELTVTLRGKADLNPEAEVSSVEAELAANNPLVGAMKTADRFSVKAGSVDVVFPLYDAAVEDLVDLCKKR